MASSRSVGSVAGGRGDNPRYARAVSTDGPDLHHAALSSIRVLYIEIAPWQELLAPGATWERAFTTPDYGRNPGYWTETTTPGTQP